MTTNKKENAGFYSMPAIRYAHVLSELGISGAAVEETEEILEQTKELKEILEHPVITKENKHDIIDRIFPEEMKKRRSIIMGQALPGKTAPETAGKNLAEAVWSCLEGEGRTLE